MLRDFGLSLRQRLSRRRLLITILGPAILLYTGYQTINAWVANADMILATRVLASGFYVAVLYIYWPDAWTALNNAKPQTKHYLIVGIWTSFLSHLGQDLYAILYRLDPAPWLLNSELTSPIVLLSVIASVLHTAAPGAVDGLVPRRNRIALGVGVGLASFGVTALLMTRPDVKPILDAIRPWIGDFWSTGALTGGTGWHA